MPRLFLLDGTALAFRSHYAFARSQLTAADGTPTGATYGFTTALRRIMEEGQGLLVYLHVNGSYSTQSALGLIREHLRLPQEEGPLVDRLQEHGIPYSVLPMPKGLFGMSRSRPVKSLLVGAMSWNAVRNYTARLQEMIAENTKRAYPFSTVFFGRQVAPNPDH